MTIHNFSDHQNMLSMKSAYQTETMIAFQNISLAYPHLPESLSNFKGITQELSSVYLKKLQNLN